MNIHWGQLLYALHLKMDKKDILTQREIMALPLEHFGIAVMI
ncbi:MAG: hypothetical protein AAF443_04460 [Chlamydiota bacterium]